MKCFQIIRFEPNPYSWKLGIIPRNLSAIEITFWHNNDTRMEISNLTRPIRIVFSRKPQPIMDQGAPDENLFLKRKELRYHLVTIPSYQAVVTVRIEPEKNISLRVYVKHDNRPTVQQFDLNLTLPMTISSSCSNISKDSCMPRDPYEFDILPNVTGHVGRHFIGIEILEHSFNNPEESAGRRRRSNDGKEDKVKGQMDLRRKGQPCVKVKPVPPTLPPPVPRYFDPKTDINYRLFVTVGTCVFWNEQKEKWSARGCEVSFGSVKNS